MIFLTSVPQSNYYITNSGKEIKISQNIQNNESIIEIFDEFGNLEHTLNESIVESLYLNEDGNLIVIGLPENEGIVKTYFFDKNTWNEIYNANNEYIIGTDSSANLGKLVHVGNNNELLIVNNSNSTNFEIDIYEENIARIANYFQTIGTEIYYPDNSLNFEIHLNTNDELITYIRNNVSSLFTIDPSYIGYIDSSSLYLSNEGFILHGKIVIVGEHNEPNVNLFYKNFSSNSITLDTILDLSINDFSFDVSSNVTYLNYTINTITLDLNRSDIDNTDILNSLILDPSNCGSIASVLNDGSNQSKKNIVFIPSFQFENSNCSLTFDYSKNFLSISKTIYFSVNNYVPQINNVINDDSFNYIDTSGTIFIEFDRSLLRDLSYNDLSYNNAKLQISLNKQNNFSYNIIVDPIGIYAETQTILVKDLLGNDLSNINIEIDTIVPNFNKINTSPNSLNFEFTESILDIEFNKILLDRNQLKLTSTSDISFVFLQQYNNEISSETNKNIIGIEPSFNNFTYTIISDSGIDVSENIIKSALQKWDNIIIKHPIDVNNNNPEGTTKIHITFSISEMDSETLGYAYVDYIYYDDNNHNGVIDYSDNIYTSSGFIALSTASYNSMITQTRSDGNTTLYYVLLHEIGHILGIGPYFGHVNSPRVTYQEDGQIKYYYTGQKALEKYRMYLNDPSLLGIPIEDDGGAGTANVHPEEHRIVGHTRHIGGHPHEGIDEELMTGWAESGNVVMPLSAISIGFLEDMGFDVSYAFADIFRDMDYNGNITSSLKMGITMDSTLPAYSTYSIVQYKVTANDYGIKNIQNIDFNYRNGYDVSSVDININTIIPDVSSIEIENILYTDTSGVITITFNDHDGYYFYGKDEFIDLHLDSSFNGKVDISMNLIPANDKIWSGTITSISGIFEPNVITYLKYNGMEGLIDIDLSAVFRLDTNIRGIYITLPNILPTRTGSKNYQTINYMTFDHTTQKLETDVSFQFNIQVVSNFDQFPYIDICENFVNIVGNINNGDTDLVGDIFLDKDIGFIDNFWHGKLTIIGEISGHFDISYNEILNPTRSDGIIESREDNLRVYVNTVLPDISNLIIPQNITYVNSSDDIKIEFSKQLLSGDENNIKLEYWIDNTSEYQFLYKYSVNNITFENSKYNFNGILDSENKLALSIGTYELNISSSHPIYLDDNDLQFISLSGNTVVSGGTVGYYGNVTLNVLNDFGTASYGCIYHSGMFQENKLIYKNFIDVSNINGNGNNWKFNITLLEEIDSTLNINVKYRDEIKGPYSINLYGVIPDVSSVILSSNKITYENQAIDFQVQYNKLLENVNNIFDLITINAPSTLIEISGNNVLYDSQSDIYIGTIKLSDVTMYNGSSLYNFVDNLKINVSSPQSSLLYYNSVSKESDFFTVDTLQQINNINLNSEHIYFPNVSQIFTIDFRIPIPDNTNVNNYITLSNDYIVSHDTFITNNNGKTWTSNITRNSDMNLLDNRLIFDYSYNDLSVYRYNISGEIVFNTLENTELRYMKFNDFGTPFIGNDSQDNLGTGIAVSYDNNIIAISSVKLGNENINIYRLHDSYWFNIGVINQRASSLVLSETGDLLAIADDLYEINGYNIGIVYIFSYIEDNNWELIYTINADSIFLVYGSIF